MTEIECQEIRLILVLYYPPSLKKKINITHLDSSTAFTVSSRIPSTVSCKASSRQSAI
jgi:hypothetical protein